MAIADEQYVQLMEQLFETQGWDILVEESRNQIYHYQAGALEAKSWEVVNQLRGKAEQLAELIAFPTIIAAQKAEMEVRDAPEVAYDADL
jgi:hypothetical protein